MQLRYKNTTPNLESCICGLLCTVLNKLVGYYAATLPLQSFWIWLPRGRAQIPRSFEQYRPRNLLLFMIALFPLLALLGPLLSVSANVDSASQALGDHLRGEWSRIVQSASSSLVLSFSNIRDL
jgi:hypothetical protein